MSGHRVFDKNTEFHDKLITGELNKDNLTTVFWKGIVVDVDDTGKKFKLVTSGNVRGALKCRILGLHNYIKSKSEAEDKERLPIVLPFFGNSGVTIQVPQIGEWVWVIFENLEPVGQSYWLGVVPGKDKERKSYFKSLYEDLFK